MSAVERMAKAMYEEGKRDTHSEMLPYAECVDYARACLAALAEPEGMEEAHKAANQAAFEVFKKYSEIVPYATICEAIETAAAPLLLARPLQELEESKRAHEVTRRNYAQSLDTLGAEIERLKAEVRSCIDDGVTLAFNHTVTMGDLNEARSALAQVTAERDAKANYAERMDALAEERLVLVNRAERYAAGRKEALEEEKPVKALLSTTQAALLRTVEGSRVLEEALTHIANAIPDSWAGRRARAALNGEEFHDAALGT